MLSHPRLVVGCAGVIVAATSFFAALESEVATARGVDISPMLINRAVKGDKMPIVPGPAGVVPARQPLLEGCESSFSAIRSSFAQEAVGRCLT